MLKLTRKNSWYYISLYNVLVSYKGSSSHTTFESLDNNNTKAIIKNNNIFLCMLTK